MTVQKVTTSPPTVKQLGDPRKDATWTLMPQPPGVCSQCGRDHEPHYPHDKQSMAYQYAFFSEHDRWPTWVDAMAHCSTEMKQIWTEKLHAMGADV